MSDFWATIEFLPGNQAAIVTLFDSKGEWSGASRIETKCRRSLCNHNPKDSLYEQGYDHASRTATWKGGRLARYSIAS